MRAINHLRRSLSPNPRRYFHRVDEVVPPASGRGPKQWVLSRALCRFASFTLPASLGAADRDRALNLMVHEASPFGETGYLTEWGQGKAGAWLWDRAAVAAAIEAAGEDPGSVTVLPETAVQQQGDNGARLVRVLDGHEGQVWQGGVLRASRFWPDMPTQAEWIRFLRSSGDPEALDQAASLSVAEPVWLERPWPRRSAGSFLGDFKGGRAVATVACIAIIPFAYQIGQVAALNLERGRYEANVKAMEVSAAPVLAARDAALRNAARVRQIEALRPYPSPTEVMARIAEILPPNGTIFQDFNYQQPDLRFTLGGQPTFDATFFIRALSAIPIFTDVNAENSAGPGTLTLRMKLVRHTS